MKTRSEILEETRLLFEEIDPWIFGRFLRYLKAIDLEEVEKLPEAEKNNLLRGYPSATIGDLCGLLKRSNLAKSTAPNHFEEEQ
jgi:hypothetical protein